MFIMAGDQPKDVLTIQTELNRQALVEVSTRLTILEQQMMLLDEETRDLKFLTDNSSETSKRLQAMIKRILAKRTVSP